MYPNYNKGGGGTKPGGVKLGNWQEELALESATGFSRTSLPFTPAFYKNHDRVMAHTDCVHPSDYQSTTTASQMHAQRGLEHGVGRVETKGPMQLLREKRALEDAKAERDCSRVDELERKNKMSYLSNNAASFTLPKRSSAPLHPASTSPTQHNSQPITYWSEALKNPDPVNSFPLTAKSGHRNPFEKSSAFSNDIRDPSKTHMGGVDDFQGRSIDVVDGGYLPPTARPEDEDDGYYGYDDREEDVRRMGASERTLSVENGSGTR